MMQLWTASPMGSVELFHGYTYSGIPVAVAAALAVQDIFEKDDIFNRAKKLAPYFQKGLFSLQDLESVENIRGYGMMGGIDMKMNTLSLVKLDMNVLKHVTRQVLILKQRVIV